MFSLYNQWMNEWMEKFLQFASVKKSEKNNNNSIISVVPFFFCANECLNKQTNIEFSFFTFVFHSPRWCGTIRKWNMIYELYTHTHNCCKMKSFFLFSGFLFFSNWIHWWLINQRKNFVTVSVNYEQQQQLCLICTRIYQSLEFPVRENTCLHA